MEDREMQNLAKNLDDLRALVEPNNPAMQVGAVQPAVFGLVHVVDQMFIDLCSLNARVKALEAKG